MSTGQNADSLFQAAMALPNNERLWLAESLFASVEQLGEDMIESEQWTVIERRVNELRDGHVKGLSLDEFRQHLRSQVERGDNSK